MASWRDEFSVAGRYVAAQLPGLFGIGLLLAIAVHFEWLGRGAALFVFVPFVAFDVVVFFQSRHVLASAPHTGAEALLGRGAVALTPLDPHGFARIGAERWRARLATGRRVEPGSALLITEVRGLELIVRPEE